MRPPQVAIGEILGELERDNLLPAIVFRSSRNQCDLDAERAGKSPRLHLDPMVQRELRARIRAIAEQYDMDLELVHSHPHYNALVSTAIGAHHAGQLLTWRLLLEELMAEGALRLLVATGTVAAGVDFPARTVVLTAHSRRGAEGFETLTSSEFQQMSGRAGRRGKDTVGFCIAAPSPFCDGRVLLELSKQPPEPLVSAYFPSPSTVLNLLRYRTVDGLHYTVERSLASFIDQQRAADLRLAADESAESLSTEAAQAFQEVRRAFVENDIERAFQSMEIPKGEKKILKRLRRMYRQASEMEKRQLVLLDSSLNGLRALGYLEGVHLSEKGYWAANLCTTLVIELAEIIQSGLLEGATVDILVAVIASISGDPHRQYLSAGKAPPLPDGTVRRIEATLAAVRDQHMPGVLEDRQVILDAAHTAVSWLYAEDWHSFRSLLLLSGVAEGDAARLITQTSEQLNQLARLTESHYELAMLAVAAKQRLLRPPLTEAINIDSL
ncbi:MAG: hypothetical protein KDD69_15105 [Bdellovibrionales bacterium]|nr:hypothetical protein [Bdellovibrionales bacterium]